jgi:hypothetical protein
MSIAMSVFNHKKHRLVSFEYKLNEKAQIRTVLLTFAEAQYLRELIGRAIAPASLPE